MTKISSSPTLSYTPNPHREETPPSTASGTTTNTADRTNLSSEATQTVGEGSTRVNNLVTALGALHDLSTADHQEWGGQTTTPTGAPIERGLTEAEEGRYQRVGEYWQDVGMDWDGRTDQPWSSAYISSLHQRAGITNFDSSIRHSTYISNAIDATKSGDEEAPYLGHRPTERAPQPGDLLCWTRNGSQASYDDQQGGMYSSHCDRVQSVEDGTITTLGGNVGNSVSTRQFGIDENGMLDDSSQNWVAILAPNNLEME